VGITQKHPTKSDDDLPHMPFPRDGVVDPAPLYRTLRATTPITRVRTVAGEVAWLVTGYAEAVALLTDLRLSRSRPQAEQAANSGAALLGAPVADNTTEMEQHEQMRRLLNPAFSARRMRAMRTHVAEIVDDLLVKVEGHGAPADLHEMLSFPLPVLIICELLGVPYGDRDMFCGWSDAMASLVDRAAAGAALQEFQSYLHVLIGQKREVPGSDVISDLIAAQPVEGYGDDDIAEVGAAFLFVGHEATVSRIDYGILLLADNVDQRDRLRADPSLVDGAVEEILRMAAPGGSGGLPCFANSDIQIGGVHIRGGDAVLIDGAATNRDPAVFAEPDTFQITRTPNPHLTFGHGARYCIGASLARVQLQEVFLALPRRLPELRLAVPLAELRLRDDRLTGGFTGLPVTW
jgi:pentalenolactone synthase